MSIFDDYDVRELNTDIVVKQRITGWLSKIYIPLKNKMLYASIISVTGQTWGIT